MWHVLALVLVGLCLGSCASLDKYADFGLAPATMIEKALKPVGNARIDTSAIVNGKSVNPPYAGAGIGSASDIRKATFNLTRCQKSLYSDTNEHNRGVSITVPKGYDLLDGRLVNTLLVAGLQFARKNCPVKAWLRQSPEEHGISMKVVQNGEVAIETGQSTSVGNDGVGFRYFRNFIAERYQSQLRETARQQWWDSYWSSVRWWIKAIIVLAVSPFILWHMPRILTRIKWFFFPHPAIRALRSATRHDYNEYVDGSLLAEAMNFTPANDVEAELAKRDLSDLRKRVAEKNDRLRQSETLMNDVRNMERAKKRVETMRIFGGLRG